MIQELKALSDWDGHMLCLDLFGEGYDSTLICGELMRYVCCLITYVY